MVSIYEFREFKTEMLNEFKKVNDTLLTLIEIVKKLDKSCSKMDDHISFVEGTYETLKTPLDFITTNVNKMIGNQKTGTLDQPRIK